MHKDSIFNILGPIMIGPSSSHTAGAERIGRAAAAILGKPAVSAKFLLHGSFATTYRGHGTDRALVAGILGLDTDDERIRESFELAEAQGIAIAFEPADLGDVHPNTVEVQLTSADGDTLSVRGSSVGGGSIRIIAIDDEPVEFDGSLPVLILKHKDQQGMISRITFTIAMQGINIANLRVTREDKGQTATTIVESDTVVPQSAVNEIAALPGVLSVRAVAGI
jgi:L-serine dehydratase